MNYTIVKYGKAFKAIIRALTPTMVEMNKGMTLESNEHTCKSETRKNIKVAIEMWI